MLSHLDPLIYGSSILRPINVESKSKNIYFNNARGSNVLRSVVGYQEWRIADLNTY